MHPTYVGHSEKLAISFGVIVISLHVWCSHNATKFISNTVRRDSERYKQFPLFHEWSVSLWGIIGEYNKRKQQT
jgi:hypothetical protein